MGTVWIDSVKARGQLIYVTVNEESWGAYKTAVSEAIREFNAFSKKNKLCVSFVKGSGGSAEVEIEVTDGPEISYSFDGKNYTEEFSGKKMHGRTPQLSRADTEKLEKAFVFLPKSPPISVPSGVRLAGSGVLKVIAFHELLHAVGLSNGEHAPDDVFQEQPQYFPGDTPVEDGIMIPNTTKHMPPIILSKATTQAVKRLWCASGGSVTAEVHYKMRQPSSQSR